MDRVFFEQFGTTYDELSAYIHALAVQMLPRRYTEWLDDVVAEGWYIALDAMRAFDIRRGVRLTTYLWPYLRFGMRRYLAQLRRYRREGKLFARYVGVQKTTRSMFESGPYLLAPDEICENRERIGMWHELRARREQEVRICLEETPKYACSRVRQQMSRRRSRARACLQQELADILLKRGVA